MEVESTVESVCCPGKRRVDVAPPSWKHGCEGSCFTSDVSTKRLALRTQRAMKQMEGYFNGYISKRQPGSRYEMKVSTTNLQCFREKMKKRKALAQVAMVTNRM